MVADDSAFWTERLNALEFQISHWEAAMAEFMANGGQMVYSFDDGQQRIKVERAEPGVMLDALNAMLNLRDLYRQRLGLANGSFYGRGV